VEPPGRGKCHTLLSIPYLLECKMTPKKHLCEGKMYLSKSKTTA
jgi:hypothetical protein